MFVKTTRVKRGNRSYEYLSLVESVRVDGKARHRTLFRLGEASALAASGELDRIVTALRAHVGGEAPLTVGALAAEAAPAVGSVAAVASVWQRLGLDSWFAKVGTQRGAEVLEHAVFAMVANRLVDPCSKRRLSEWTSSDVKMPEGWSAPSLDQYYRAIDAVADAKETTETHLYARLTDLTNLDLRLVCYDLTSTYFEGSTRPSDRFPSRAFGYSRDHRGDRPQVVIGLLCTSDGIPIAHHVFAGNTNDAATLAGVLDDLADRFAVGRICVVADRGLISVANVEVVADAGFDHIFATRLHRDASCAQALEAAEADDTVWVDVTSARSRAAEVTLDDGTRAVVVASDARHRRDTARTAELVAATETKLLALEHRVRDGRLKDAAKIGRATQRILGEGGVARLFDVEIAEGRFVYHYDEDAFDYEQALAGRYVLTTSLTTTQASTVRIVTAYRQLLNVESRFRVLKDFLHLRPVRHWTEQRVRGHIAICVYAALIETLINQALTQADIADPDIADQHLTAQRALRELDRIRAVNLSAGAHTIDVITRPSSLQAAILAALNVDTTSWNRARIT